MELNNRNRTVKPFMVALALLTCAASALADGGKVLPSWESPHGYSLKHIARATAVYNTGQQSGNPLTPPPPDVPFHVLLADATVDRGTMFYVPIFYEDDSGGTPPGFPAHVGNQEEDADYLDSTIFGLFGVTAFMVQVDGKTTVLDDDYIAGVHTASLLDGIPGGTHYIISECFLSPLERGQHTVGIGGIIGGQPVVFVSYNVTVH